MRIVDSVFLLAVLVYTQPQQLVYSSSNSLCYGEGKAFRCMPPFSNIIEGLPPTFVSSTCGTRKKQRICGDKNVCHSCTKGSHSPNLLTDPHVDNNSTFWASDYVEPGESVNVTFSFKKLFEIYYISLAFLPMLEPDGILVEKSADYGKTWSPWHYFAKDCSKTFGVPTTDMLESKEDSEQRVLCSPIVDSKQLDTSSANLIVAFTTSSTFSKTGDQHSTRMSATDIKISLHKSPANSPHSNFDGFTYPPLLKQYFDRFAEMRRNKSMESAEKRALKESPSVLHVYEYFSIADISVGGRCQCYGHSNSCLKNPMDDTFNCDCQHNTAGKDCSICKNDFVDRPWSMATSKYPGECKRCNCNLHSRKCEFDKNLYILSERQSGGVCIDCKHETAGRFCHHCKTGFFRDWSKPLSHQHVCQKCRCHPIGSTEPDQCDQRTSQCRCKYGVIGLSCNRCQKGFQQTRSPINPCVKSFDLNKIPMAQDPEQKCPRCRNKRKRIRFKKYCRKDAVLLVTVQSREQHVDMVRYEMKVNNVWRVDSDKFHSKQSDLLASMNAVMANRSTHSTFPLWVKEVDLRCNCPSLQLGLMYLVVLHLNTIKYLHRSELLFDPKCVALSWQKEWIQRMEKFSERDRKGFCVKLKRAHRHRGKNNL